MATTNVSKRSEGASSDGPGNVAAVLYGARDLRVEETPMPCLMPREVLVEVRRIGVCGSDVHYYEDGRIGNFVVDAPMIVGHEAAGVVVECGVDAHRHQVGQRVCLEPGVPCGRCRECRGGRYNLCRDVRFFATPPVDGACARYVAIHEDFAFALPDEVSDDAGALVEPLSCGLWACQKAAVSGGDEVLITGAGPIGLIVAQVARALGATTITVTDVNDARLAAAISCGATTVINVANEELAAKALAADAFIECSGDPRALMDGIRSLRPAGRAVAVGLQRDLDAVIPLNYLQTHEIELTGTFRYANTYPAAIALAASGRVNLESLITGYFDLEQTEAALRASREDASSIKSMITVVTTAGADVR